MFDAVFCNAALHHMRDVSKAISEALRVLKQGGILVTTCDSFRPDSTKEDFELKIFDAEPAVLLGVNEGIPRLTEFIEPLFKNLKSIKVELFTHELSNFKKVFSAIGLFKNITFGRKKIPNDKLFDPSMKKWNLKADHSFLKKQSGSLALRILLEEVWPEKALYKKTLFYPPVNMQNGYYLVLMQFKN